MSKGARSYQSDRLMIKATAADWKSIEPTTCAMGPKGSAEFSQYVANALVAIPPLPRIES